MEPIFLAFGLAFVGYGLLGLFGLWLAPGVMRWAIYSPRRLTGTLPDTPGNRALMLCWFLLIGTWLAMSSAGFVYWSLLPLVAFVAVSFVIGSRKGTLRAAHKIARDLTGQRRDS